MNNYPLTKFCSGVNLGEYCPLSMSISVSLKKNEDRLVFEKVLVHELTHYLHLSGTIFGITFTQNLFDILHYRIDNISNLNYVNKLITKASAFETEIITTMKYFHREIETPVVQGGRSSLNKYNFCQLEPSIGLIGLERLSGRSVIEGIAIINEILALDTGHSSKYSHNCKSLFSINSNTELSYLLLFVVFYHSKILHIAPLIMFILFNQPITSDAKTKESYLIGNLSKIVSIKRRLQDIKQPMDDEDCLMAIAIIVKELDLIDPIYSLQWHRRILSISKYSQMNPYVTTFIKIARYAEKNPFDFIYFYRAPTSFLNRIPIWTLNISNRTSPPSNINDSRLFKYVLISNSVKAYIVENLRTQRRQFICPLRAIPQYQCLIKRCHGRLPQTRIHDKCALFTLIKDTGLSKAIFNNK